MFIRRTLSFDAPQPGVAEPLLRREYFSDVVLASEHLARAHVHAESLLADARAQGEQLLADAQAQFWDRANALLEGWEAERQAQREALVEQARSLLSETLASLLGTLSDEERALALVRQIAQSQTRPVRATLRCSVDLHESVDAWLQQQPHTHWQLERDTGLAPGTLWLSTESGDFSLDWERLRERILDLA
ncbi:type III secretion system stator protein SctL [Pseudomonas quasicaspiana]|nr:type III secretion system stator protein SctL [Pseudomonas syringae]MDG6399240.1 type III secretion system stator protein SctL [Pseudomonas quasicaspiana]